MRWDSYYHGEGWHILDIPMYYQRDNHSCGYYSTLAVMEYFGRDARWLRKRLKTTRDGTRQTNIIRTLRNSYISVNVVRDATMEIFEKAVDNNRPAIIYDHREDHWMVAHGYNEQGALLVYCPQRGDRLFHPASIDRSLNNFAMVCGDKWRQDNNESPTKVRRNRLQ